MEKQILIEVYCGSVDDAIAAQAGGADRIELNSAMFLGGLTPSLGSLIEVKKQLDIPVMVMIRPRGGGFCYTEAEMATMERDTELAIQYGADGIVFGILKGDGTIDRKRCERLLEIIGEKEAVFHRAFDVIPDPYLAMDELIDLGIDRILTKGKANRIEEGAEMVKRFIEYAEGRIEILPGGIKPFNYKEMIKKIGCDQIHISSVRKVLDSSTADASHLFFGGALYPSEVVYEVVNQSGVQAMREKVDQM